MRWTASYDRNQGLSGRVMLKSKSATLAELVTGLDPVVVIRAWYAGGLRRPNAELLLGGAVIDGLRTRANRSHN